MLTAVLLIAYAPRKWFKNKQFVNLGNIVSQEMKTTERFIIFRTYRWLQIKRKTMLKCK